MIKPKVERQNYEQNLAAALDQSIEAAFDLRISKSELVARLSERFNRCASIDKPAADTFEPNGSAYEPSAGP